MASNVTRDHHRWTRDITVPQNTTIDVEGDLIVDVSGGQFTIQDDTNGDPDLILKCTASDAFPDLAASLIFEKNKDGTGADAANSDILGTIAFNGFNDAGTPEELTYSYLFSQTIDITEDTEEGSFGIQVRTKSASGSQLYSGLYLAGTNTNGEINVNIASGTSSMTTIAGDLDIDGDTITTAGDITLDAVGDITLDAYGKQIYFGFNGTNYISFDINANDYRFMSTLNVNDYFNINIGGEGATTLSTVDADSAAAHLTIAADGHVEFDNCAVGFDEIEATFGASGVIGNGGPSTDIDFRLGNKFLLEMGTSNIDHSQTEYLNFIFPATSGNFILVIGQDGTGSRTISDGAWQAYQVDGSTKATNAAFANGTDGVIRWAGGSAPTLTTTADKSDIVSIYWDADNQTAFAVVSLNF